MTQSDIAPVKAPKVRLFLGHPVGMSLLVFRRRLAPTVDPELAA